MDFRNFVEVVLFGGEVEAGHGGSPLYSGQRLKRYDNVSGEFSSHAHMDIGIKGMDDRCKILERVFYSEIPLTKNMGVRVTEYDESLVVLTAPLKPNINIHGTAFAGSLYSLAALAGWGLLYLKLIDEQLRGHIVLGEGKIVYRSPVEGKIEARCFLGESKFKTFRENFRTDKGARIHLRSEVLSGSVVAASYDGDYRVQG